MPSGHGYFPPPPPQRPDRGTATDNHMSVTIRRINPAMPGIEAWTIESPDGKIPIGGTKITSFPGRNPEGVLREGRVMLWSVPYSMDDGGVVDLIVAVPLPEPEPLPPVLFDPIPAPVVEPVPVVPLTFDQRIDKAVAIFESIPDRRNALAAVMAYATHVAPTESDT